MMVWVMTAVSVGPGVTTVRVNSVVSVEMKVVGGTIERLVTVTTVPGRDTVLI
jgi:hypothetical protein